MYLLWLLSLAVFGASLGQELSLAGPCDAVNCQLPDCRCSSTDIPGGLAARDTPQFVQVTFDDGINILNIETYRDFLYSRVNSNNCPVGATFFINHEYTSYQLVNELYNNGFEIALHSVTHRTPQNFWAEATVEDIRGEIGDQILLMSHFANIPYEHIRGVRIPFLQLAGNSSFQVMKEFGLLYDSTWSTISYTDPGLWPYTLDYASIQDCQSPPCPWASIPGPWVNPMVSWLDLNGVACAMVDACYFVPPLTDEDAWFNFILTNFERHYLGNRAPFGFYVHEWYVRANPAVGRALVRFMDQINLMQDVFMVNSGDVIDWVRNPVPVNEYRQQPCRAVAPAPCPAASCGPLYSSHNIEMAYWMAICNTCPVSYPWFGNPLGV